MKTLSICITQSQSEYLSRLALDVGGDCRAFHSFKEIDEALTAGAFRRFNFIGYDLTSIFIVYGEATYQHWFALEDIEVYGVNDREIDLLQDLKRTFRAMVRNNHKEIKIAQQWLGYLEEMRRSN